MSLTTPTIAAINANIIAQLEAAFGQAIPFLPKAFSRVLAKALAAVFVLLYKYGGWIFLQLFVSSASFDETEVNGIKVRPLVEWGRLVGVEDPQPATRAELQIAITVDQQIGDLAAGSLLIRPDTGVIYSVLHSVALDAPTIYASVQAVDDSAGELGAGTLGNLPTGAELEFASPLPYVQRVAVVHTVLATAADAESPEAYRERVLERFRAKPQGGAYADYRVWGSEVEGIARIYPYRGAPGEVDVYVESTSPPDGLPTADQIAAVASAIQLDVDGLASRRPVTALVNVLSVARISVDVEISGLTTSGSMSELRGDLEAAIDEHLRGRRRFIVGLDVLPNRSYISSAEIGGIIARVVNAAGATFNTSRVLVGGGAITSQILEPGQLAKLGAAIYI